MLVYDPLWEADLDAVNIMEIVDGNNGNGLLYVKDYNIYIFL